MPCVVGFQNDSCWRLLCKALGMSLHNPRESVVVRIGIGCKASLQPIAGLLARKTAQRTAETAYH